MIKVVHCHNCNGTGSIKTIDDCEVCNGVGRYRVIINTPVNKNSALKSESRQNEVSETFAKESF